MNQSDLIATLMAKRGAFVVSLIAETIPKVRKTGNPYKDVTKVVNVLGMLNWIYANSVNNQRAREGNEEFFVPHRRAWGERLRRDDKTYTPFVVHKGKHYLELKVQRYISEQYFSDGKEVEKSLLEPFLYERDDSGRQDVIQPIILRDYEVGNIKSIVMDGGEVRIAA